MSITTNFYQSCDPTLVTLPSGRTYLKNLEMLDSPEVNWSSSRTFRVLSAVGFMPTDGDFWGSQNGLLASDLAKACQTACDRIHTDGFEWLSEFCECDIDLQSLAENIATLRDACESAIAIGEADTIVQFN